MKNDNITNSMPAYIFEQWKHHINCLKDLACDCLATKPVSAISSKASVPATLGTDAIPSTSGAHSLVDNDSLQAVHMVKENEKEPYQVTVFRPICQAQKPTFDSKAQNTKFDRFKEDSSFDSVDSLDFNKNN